MPRRESKNRPSLNDGELAQFPVIEKDAEDIKAANASTSSECVREISVVRTYTTGGNVKATAASDVTVGICEVPVETEVVLLPEGETVATSPTHSTDVIQNIESTEISTSSQGNGGSTNLSLEALCQAAKSELQNISKQKTHNGGAGDGGAVFVERTIPIGQTVVSNVTPGTICEVTESGTSKDYVELVPAAPFSGAARTFTIGKHQIIREVNPSNPLSTNTRVILTRVVNDVADIPARGKQVFVSAAGDMQPLQTIEISTPQDIHTLPNGIMIQSTGGRRRKHPAKPGRHICPYCGRGCAKPSVLEKHIRAHTGERPYPCTPCSISFKTKSNLYKHCKSRAHQAKIGMIGPIVSSTGEMHRDSTDVAPDEEGNSFDSQGAFVESSPADASTSRVLVQSVSADNYSKVTPPSKPIQPRVVNVVNSPTLNAMIIHQQPDGSIVLKPQPGILLGKVASPNEVFLSTLRVPISTSTTTSQVDSKHVTVRSTLEKMPDKSMKVTIQLPKPNEMGDAPNPSMGNLLQFSPSQLIPVSSQMSPDLQKHSPTAVLTSRPQFIPNISFASTTVTRPLESSPVATVAIKTPVTSEKQTKINTSGISPADVTARISYLIDKNQAIVNTPMSEAPRLKRVLRQRSEMFPDVHSDNADLLRVQRLNRAQSMDVSLLSKPERAHTTTFLQPQPLPVPMRYRVMDDGQTIVVEDNEVDAQQALHDESGDAVVVLQHLHDTSADDEVVFTSAEDGSPHQSAEQAGGNPSAVKEILLRKSTNPPHPLLHHVENSDAIVQPSLYNYKCTECNEELYFADIKSIQDHVQIHMQSSHVTSVQDDVQQQSSHVIQQATPSEVRHLMHSQSVQDVSVRRSSQSHTLTPSRSLDSADPPSFKKHPPPLKRAPGNVVLELVDPTQPPKRGRPKGARNLPKGQSSTESETEVFFGSTRGSRETSFPSFMRTWSTVEAPQATESPANRESVKVDLNFFKEPHTTPQCADATTEHGEVLKQRDRNYVKLMLKGKILKRSLDSSKLSLQELEPLRIKDQPTAVQDRVTSSKDKVKDLIRQTRSLDDPPPNKRPKLMRQRSVVESFPTQRREKIQRQVVVDNMTQLEETEPSQNKGISEQVSQTHERGIDENPALSEKSKSVEVSVETVSKDKQTRFTRIPLITVTSDELSGSRTEILSDDAVANSTSCHVTENVESLEESASSPGAFKSTDIDPNLNDFERQTLVDSHSKQILNKSCESVLDTSQGNLIILECDQKHEREVESMEELPKMVLSAGNKQVLSNLFGFSSILDHSDVTMLTGQPITNRGTEVFSYTSPCHAPYTSSLELQCKHLPLSVARKIPGMVRCAESMDIDGVEDSEQQQIDTETTEQSEVIQMVNSDKCERTESTTDALNELANKMEVDQGEWFGGDVNKTSQDRLDKAVSKHSIGRLDQDVDCLEIDTDDASPEIWNKETEKLTASDVNISQPPTEFDHSDNVKCQTIDVVTNQSTYTIQLGGAKKSQPQNLKQMSEDSVCSQPEALSELPLELQDKSEVVFTLVGHQYPVLRTNTHTTLCSVHKPQPMYVPQDKNHKLSMYSHWRAAPFNPNPDGLSTQQLLRMYRTQKGEVVPMVLTAPSLQSDSLQLIHSSYGKMDANGQYKTGDPDDAGSDVVFTTSEAPSKYKIEVLGGAPTVNVEAPSTPVTPHKSEQHPIQRAETDPTSNMSLPADGEYLSSVSTQRRLFTSLSVQSTSRMSLKSLGYKSEEDYTYVRGRGRGKYVCKECGIRCKKPSMLKKHVRTHTDLRPFVCKYCTFAFKTKGNLTKHMKSKSHHKKCTEMGLIPVPMSVDDTCIDTGDYTIQTSFPDEPQRTLGEHSASYDTSGDANYNTYMATDDDNDDVDDDDEQEVEEEQVDMENMVVVEPPEDMTSSQEDNVVSQEPRFIAIQNTENGEPMLLKITTDAQGQTRSEIVDLGSPTNKSLEGLARDSADKEVAASLLDLSKRADKGAAAKCTFSRSVAFDVADSQSLDSQKAHERLDSLIGKLIHRTDAPDDNTSHKEEHTDPAFALLNHPMLYSNIQSKSPTSSTIVTLTTSNASDPSLQPKTTRKTPGSGFVPPSFSDNDEAQPANIEASPPTVILKVPGSDNISKKDLDDMIGNILKQVKLESKQKIVLQIQLPEKEESHESTSAMLSSESKDDDDLSTCVNPQEVHSDRYAAPPQSVSSTGRNRLTDSQIRQMDPSLQDSGLNVDAKVGVSRFIPPRRLSRALKRQASFNEPDQATPEIRIENPKLKTGEVILQHERQATNNKPFVSMVKNVIKRKTVPVEIHPIPGRSHKVEKIDGSFECHLCKKLFPESALLQAHLKVHAFDLPYRCATCNSAFRMQESLDRHMQSDAHLAQVQLKGRLGVAVSDSPRPYRCVDCDVAFRIHGHLAKHLRSKGHITALENLGKLPMGTSIELEKTQFMGMTVSALDSHSNLNDILNLIKKGKINVDTTNFRWPSDFQPIVHKASDAITSRQSSYVETSGQSKHTATPVRSVSFHSSTPHKCGICGRSFSDMDLLKEHLVSHAEIRPYVCQYCDAGFTNAPSLETHLDTHTQSEAAKTFMCQDCNVQFDSFQSLLQHFKTEHGVSSAAKPQQTVVNTEENALNTEEVVDSQQDVVHEQDVNNSQSVNAISNSDIAHVVSSHKQTLPMSTNQKSHDHVESTSSNVTSAETSDGQQSVQIVQGAQDKSDSSKIQVIQLNPDAFELKEVVQADEHGVERPLKIMVINWDKVPPEQRIFENKLT